MLLVTGAVSFYQGGYCQAVSFTVNLCFGTTATMAHLGSNECFSRYGHVVLVSSPCSVDEMSGIPGSTVLPAWIKFVRRIHSCGRPSALSP